MPPRCSLGAALGPGRHCGKHNRLVPLSCRGGAAPGCNPIVRLQPDCALQVQRQSCDLVAAINAILDVQPAAEHVMMMEDDWLFCPHGLESLRYFLSKAP